MAAPCSLTRSRARGGGLPGRPQRRALIARDVAVAAWRSSTVTLSRWFRRPSHWVRRAAARRSSAPIDRAEIAPRALVGGDRALASEVSQAVGFGGERGDPGLDLVDPRLHGREPVRRPRSTRRPTRRPARGPRPPGRRPRRRDRWPPSTARWPDSRGRSAAAGDARDHRRRRDRAGTASAPESRCGTAEARRDPSEDARRGAGPAGRVEGHDWRPEEVSRGGAANDRSSRTADRFFLSLASVPIEPPPSRWALPQAADAADGEVAGVGADLEPGTLLSAYRRGLFPMRLAPGGPLGWWSPSPRGVLPLDGLQVSRSLRRSTRRFAVTVDTAFEAVMWACADRRRDGGWIDEAFVEAYSRAPSPGLGP